MLGPFFGPKDFDFILIIYLSSRGGQPISNFKWLKSRFYRRLLAVLVLAECMEFFVFEELK
jgi:hypothetical protein